MKKGTSILTASDELLTPAEKKKLEEQLEQLFASQQFQAELAEYEKPKQEQLAKQKQAAVSLFSKEIEKQALEYANKKQAEYNKKIYLNGSEMLTGIGAAGGGPIAMPMQWDVIQEEFQPKKKKPQPPKPAPKRMGDDVRHCLKRAIALVMDNLEPNGVVPPWVIPRLRKLVNELHAKGSK